METVFYVSTQRGRVKSEKSLIKNFEGQLNQDGAKTDLKKEEDKDEAVTKSNEVNKNAVNLNESDSVTSDVASNRNSDYLQQAIVDRDFY